jgi:hypothetical protein
MSDVFIALIGIPLAALVGAIAYRWQKIADQKSGLIEMRRKNYTTFLENVFFRMRDSSDESRDSYQRGAMALSVIASDEVVRKAGLFVEHVKMPNDRIDQDKGHRLLGDLIIAIRKDCFESTELTPDEIRRLLPFR